MPRKNKAGLNQKYLSFVDPCCRQKGQQVLNKRINKQKHAFTLQALTKMS